MRRRHERHNARLQQILLGRGPSWLTYSATAHDKKTGEPGETRQTSDPSQTLIRRQDL